MVLATTIEYVLFLIQNMIVDQTTCFIFCMPDFNFLRVKTVLVLALNKNAEIP